MTLAVAVLVGAAAGADADEGPGARAAKALGVYVSAGVGAAYSGNRGLGGERSVYFDLGRPVGSLSLGLAGRRGWRVEVEGSYRYNDAEVVFGGGQDDLQPDADSRIEARSLGVNVLYEPDVPLGFRPYVGAGLARARTSFEINEYRTGATRLDDEDTALVWQVIAGFGVRLGRRLELLADYRYWRAPEIELEAPDGASVNTDYRVHSAMLGLRYAPLGPAPGAGSRAVERNPGWYVRAQGGMSFAKDAEIQDSLSNFDAFDVGEVATLALGRTVGRRWRVELEGVHSRHDSEIIDFGPLVGEARAAGRVQDRSLMANVVYEPGWSLPVRPYAGIGAGMAWSDWDVRLRADDAVFVDDTGSAPAAQVMLGAAAGVSTSLQVTAEFRYWITDRFDLEQPDGRPLRSRQSVNSLMLGLRYTLH